MPKQKKQDNLKLTCNQETHWIRKENLKSKAKPPSLSRQLFLTSFSNQCRQLSEFSPLDHSEVFDTSDQTILLMCLQHWLATSVLAVSLQQSIHCLYSNESSPAGYTYKPVLFHTPPSLPSSHISLHLWESKTQLCASLKPTDPQLSWLPFQIKNSSGEKIPAP